MPSLTPSEEAQYLDTISMFEVITQEESTDVQSLDILKEAYLKLERHEEALKTSKKIAKAYADLGQLSNALFEYESILQQNPGDKEAEEALAAIESQASDFGAADDEDDADAAGSGVDMISVGGPDLGGGAVDSAGTFSGGKVLGDDGRNGMRKVFVDSGKISEQEFDACWPDFDETPAKGKVNNSFIQNLADKQILPLEDSMALMCGKNRFAYVPLDNYEIDAEMARTYPGEICRRWSVLPIDKMSKSILVATSNPYNKAAAKQLEEFSKSRVIWYVAAPEEINKIVTKYY